jgi:hypothetical protein
LFAARTSLAKPTKAAPKPAAEKAVAEAPAEAGDAKAGAPKPSDANVGDESAAAGASETHDTAVPGAGPVVPPPVVPSPSVPRAPAPLAAGEPGWQFGFYGWLELDALWDSTQSFNETILDQNIARPFTYAGDNPRFQGTVKDSRIGFKVAAPMYGSIKVSGQFEADFFGILPPTASLDQSATYSTIRLRHYFAKVETPVVDLLVGQTFDLYGWGGQGFFPSTPAFLGVMGEVFHRNVQLRLSKTIRGPAASFEIAAAGVRPATRDSGVPDVQAGLKLSINGLQGASAQGPRPARAAPLAFAVSAVGRRLTVNDFQAIAADAQTAYGWGLAANAFVPIIPVSGDDYSNALSVTGEYSRGTGVADLYLTLNGGVLFPALPNPKNVLPAPVYAANIDQGIATFDANGLLKTINWQGWMVNAHYNVPFNKGKTLSLAGTYSEIRSSNDLELTPPQGRPFVWNKGRYFDATLWWSITPAFQICFSFQTETQTLGDGTIARNDRAQAGFWFFF